jgi:hypothetical protein
MTDLDEGRPRRSLLATSPHARVATRRDARAAEYSDGPRVVNLHHIEARFERSKWQLLAVRCGSLAISK